MIETAHRSPVIAALRSAAPYLRMYQGKTFVIKAGGGVFGTPGRTRSFLEQVALLHQLGIRLVFVHGGGPQSTEVARALGIESRFVEGRRLTCEKSLEVAIMVLNGLVNTRILAAFRELGIPAIGMSGVDAGLIQARKRSPIPIDFGLVGDIIQVEPSVVEKQIQLGFLPVVSPISADGSGTILNVNADTAASALAVALRAEKLILATGAQGILEDPADPRSVVCFTDLGGLERLERAGSFEDGMMPKAACIERALSGGVPRVHVVSFTEPDALLVEIFTNEGAGTLVVSEIASLAPEERAAARVHA